MRASNIKETGLLQSVFMKSKIENKKAFKSLAGEAVRVSL